MTPTPRLQFTSIRTRIEGGQPLIGLKHTAKGAGDLPISTAWIEMPPEDVKQLILKLQEALNELEQK